MRSLNLSGWARPPGQAPRMVPTVPRAHRVASARRNLLQTARRRFFARGSIGDGDDDVSMSSSPSTSKDNEVVSTSTSDNSAGDNPNDPLRPYRRSQASAMLRFMAPAALIPLADPLLTLVDVLFISHGGDAVVPGRLVSSFFRGAKTATWSPIKATAVEQLAALSPNAQIFTFIQYMLGGLGVATINEVSSCLRGDGGGGGESDESNGESSGSGGGDTARASALASAALAAAAVVGALTALALWSPFVGRQRAIAATGFASAPASSSSSQSLLLSLATSYLNVRAFGVPLALISGVCQAALLAQRDARSPARAVALQVAVNVFGDWLLVSRMRMGLPGAALATVVAQGAGLVLLLRALCSSESRARPSVGALRGAFSTSTSTPSSSSSSVSSSSPVSALAATAGPVTLTYFAKTASYWSIQGSASRLPDVRATAAHQPLWSAWTLLSFAHSPLEAGALAFVPAAAAAAEKAQQKKAATIRVVAEATVIVGTATSLAAAAIALCPTLLTPDGALHPLLRSLAPQAAIATAFCAADVAASGCLVATRRLAPLVRSMVVAAAVTTATARAFGGDLPGVWWSLVAFFASRALGSCGALWRAGEFRGILGRGGGGGGEERRGARGLGVAAPSL